MRLPRFIHRLYAWLTGRFWLPCPICGREFGGHENGTGHLLTNFGEGEMVCPNCVDEATRRNAEYIRDHPIPPRVVWLP